MKKRRINAWRELYEEAKEEVKERQLAKKLWEKHMFNRLRYGIKAYKDIIGVSINLSIK